MPHPFFNGEAAQRHMSLRSPPLLRPSSHHDAVVRDTEDSFPDKDIRIVVIFEVHIISTRRSGGYDFVVTGLT